MIIGLEFESVLAAARTGADWAWNRLYRALAPEVLAYLRGRGPDAEDVLGEVWLQVVRDLSRFGGDEAAFRGWVFTVARNRAIDAVRARKRRPADPLDAASGVEPGGDVEDEAVQNLASRELIEAIRGLNPDQRDVILLRMFGGFSVPEVADLLRKREGTVKSLQRRGLDRLQGHLPAEVHRSRSPQRSLS